MEVETHSLSAFDLHPTPNQPFSLEIHSPFSNVSHPINGGSQHALGHASAAALRLQKVYRGYRTRRRLADSAVVAEELWWQAIDYVRLNHSTISFFNFPETVASRWTRVTLIASKVGKGLSKDAKAQKLAFQHWIEAIDPRHRYGHNLQYYYQQWCKTDAGQPFFYWLDLGNGKNLNLQECPRSKLQKQCIKYLGPQEREQYEYIVCEGKIIHKQSGDFLHTNEGFEFKGDKWIFVMSTSKKLYAGKVTIQSQLPFHVPYFLNRQSAMSFLVPLIPCNYLVQKKKGLFHHSSFLAGGATFAAGRLVAKHGTLKSISAYSGHYRPTDDSLNSFLSYLTENGVKLDEVEMHKVNEDSDIYEESKLSERPSTTLKVSSNVKSEEAANSTKSSAEEVPQPELVCTSYKRTLSGGLQSPRAEVPKTAIMQRINSKKTAKSYQLGHRLSLKWSTGAGPRIGCVADYPVELRIQALEMLNLSPRIPPTPSSYMRIGDLVSPLAPCPTPNTGSSGNTDETYVN